LAIYQALEKRDPFEAFHQMFLHLDYVRHKVLKEYPKMPPLDK